MKAWIQKMLGDFKFDKDVYFNDKRFFVKKDDANKMFPFKSENAKNFPGIEWTSKEIEITDLDFNKKLNARLSFTYHNDLNRWTSVLQCYGDDLNMVSTLNSIEISDK